MYRIETPSNRPTILSENPDHIIPMRPTRYSPLEERTSLFTLEWLQKNCIGPLKELYYDLKELFWQIYENFHPIEQIKRCWNRIIGNPEPERMFSL